MRPHRQQPRIRRSSSRDGRFVARTAAVLLEVLVALTLFVFAAAIISSSLSVAVDRTLRLHDQAHALDLAASVLAEVELAIRPGQPAGPDAFEAPFENWTWQIEAVPYSFGGVENPGLQTVTVIVRHAGGSVVQRLTEIIATPDPNSASPSPVPGVPALGFAAP